MSVFLRSLSPFDAGNIEVLGTLAFIVRPAALTVISVQLSFRSVVDLALFHIALQVAFYFHPIANVLFEVAVAVQPIEERRIVTGRTQRAGRDLFVPPATPTTVPLTLFVNRYPAPSPSPRIRQPDSLTLLSSGAGAAASRSPRCCDGERQHCSYHQRLFQSLDAHIVLPLNHEPTNSKGPFLQSARQSIRTNR